MTLWIENVITVAFRESLPDRGVICVTSFVETNDWKLKEVVVNQFRELLGIFIQGARLRGIEPLQVLGQLSRIFVIVMCRKIEPQLAIDGTRWPTTSERCAKERDTNSGLENGSILSGSFGSSLRCSI